MARRTTDFWPRIRRPTRSVRRKSVLRALLRRPPPRQAPTPPTLDLAGRRRTHMVDRCLHVRRAGSSRLELHDDTAGGAGGRGRPRSSPVARPLSNEVPLDRQVVVVEAVFWRQIRSFLVPTEGRDRATGLFGNETPHLFDRAMVGFRKTKGKKRKFCSLFNGVKKVRVKI
jgi:hypothetical protein